MTKLYPLANLGEVSMAGAHQQGGSTIARSANVDCDPPSCHLDPSGRKLHEGSAVRDRQQRKRASRDCVVRSSGKQLKHHFCILMQVGTAVALEKKKERSLAGDVPRGSEGRWIRAAGGRGGDWVPLVVEDDGGQCLFPKGFSGFSVDQRHDTSKHSAILAASSIDHGDPEGEEDKSIHRSTENSNQPLDGWKRKK